MNNDKAIAFLEATVRFMDAHRFAITTVFSIIAATVIQTIKG